MPEDSKDEGTIILQTRRMHCGDCRYKVSKAISGYPGVEQVTLNLAENEVTLIAPKVNAMKLFESVKKKSGGKVTNLLYPDPKDIQKPIDVTVVLKVAMDCSSFTRKVEKAAWKIKDVQSVKADDDILTVKGVNLDPKKVCEAITKKSGKHAKVMPPKGDEQQAPQVPQNIYAPQYFSDENPNACVLM